MTSTQGFMVFVAASPIVMFVVLAAMVLRKKARQRANAPRR